MLTLTWIKCENGNWCNLERLNLETAVGEGVYIIWHGGETPRVVRVGQGSFSARFQVHRTNPQILAYKKRGDLFVTWASVQESYRNGVERYLSEKWNPLVGEAFPDVLPIAVNSPFP